MVEIPEQLPAVSLDATRSERFPGRVERVKLYMSNWYAPPCEGYSDGLVRYVKNETAAWPTYSVHEARDATNATTPSFVYVIESVVAPDKIFVVDRGTILDCSDGGVGSADYALRVKFRSNMRMYCTDVARLLLPAMDHVAWEQKDGKKSAAAPPMLVQFGDLAHSHVYQYVSVPHLKKFRLAASTDALRAVTERLCYDEPRVPLKEGVVLQPIVWKLATHRHYGLLDQVAENDKAWEEKKNKAVFRGQLTGSLGFNKRAAAEESCLKLHRCRLVYNHANSTLLNAKLTSTRKRLPNVINGVNLTTSSISVRHLLKYKGIVMLEGNDVASGLKWALLSNSVVLMPIPRRTSWAMEELLQPWVHYVPLNDEATDVEEKMMWIRTHDADAQRISYAATLWIQDLAFHPDAAEDDRWIQEEIVRRYQRHFASRIIDAGDAALYPAA